MLGIQILNTMVVECQIANTMTSLTRYKILNTLVPWPIQH
jgi:hypothetical protein